MKIKRNIVKIDEEKCDGCGLCVDACAEGAIQIVDGKARLVSDVYCDGLGACLGDCPRGAITIEEREAEAFDEKAVGARQGGDSKPSGPPPGGCPGMKSFSINKPKSKSAATSPPEESPSELTQWPVQLALVPPVAPYWNGADLLISADCAAHAHGGFHQRFLSGRKLVIACPKLDDTTPYLDKLTAILASNDVKSVTVVRMEVPCCAGIVKLAQEALNRSGKTILFRAVVMGINGEIKADESI